MWRADTSYSLPLPINKYITTPLEAPVSRGICAEELISQPNPLWENELSSVLEKLSDRICM